MENILLANLNISKSFILFKMSITYIANVSCNARALSRIRAFTFSSVFLRNRERREKKNREKHKNDQQHEQIHIALK